MIVCGWCGKATANTDRCTSCGHTDPERPWTQRGDEVPTVPTGRPPLDVAALHRRIAEARASLTAAGQRPTAERLAEQLDVSPRTLRRWQMASARPVMTNAISGPATATPRGVR